MADMACGHALASTKMPCPSCDGAEFMPARGRFGPIWRCENHPKCKVWFSTQPTGAYCNHPNEAGLPCGAPMVAGTKTIPDRCSLKACPNRNPHKLNK